MSKGAHLVRDLCLGTSHKNLAIKIQRPQSNVGPGQSSIRQTADRLFHLVSALRRTQQAIGCQRERLKVFPGHQVSMNSVLDDFGNTADACGQNRLSKSNGRHQNATLVDLPVRKDDRPGRAKKLGHLRLLDGPKYPVNSGFNLQLARKLSQCFDVHLRSTGNGEPQIFGGCWTQPGKGTQQYIDPFIGMKIAEKEQIVSARPLTALAIEVTIIVEHSMRQHVEPARVHPSTLQNPAFAEIGVNDDGVELLKRRAKTESSPFRHRSVEQRCVVESQD